MKDHDAQNIIEVGKRLIQAKSLVKYGEWQDWLEQNFSLSYRSAARFIDCAEKFSNVPTLAGLNKSQMVQLLSLPDAEETEKFIAEKAAEGKAVADISKEKIPAETGRDFVLQNVRIALTSNRRKKMFRQGTL